MCRSYVVVGVICLKELNVCMRYTCVKVICVTKSSSVLVQS